MSDGTVGGAGLDVSEEESEGYTRAAPTRRAGGRCK